jgi:branched-chain amino acid transport system substrate-binding protein
MRVFAQALAAILILMLATGTAFAADTVRVGLILPLTGSDSGLGAIEQASFELAVSSINNSGGIGGSRIEMVVEDSMDEPEAARAAVRKLMDEDKVALICSGGGFRSVHAAAGIALNRGFPFLIISTPEDALTEPASYTPSSIRARALRNSLGGTMEPKDRAKAEKAIRKLEKKARSEGKRLRKRFSIFRLGPPLSEYSAGVLSLLKKTLKPKTAAIVHEDTDTGSRQAGYFEEAAKKIGIKTIFSKGFDPNGGDLQTILAAADKESPDILYMISYMGNASRLAGLAGETMAEGTVLAGEGTRFMSPALPQAAEGMLVSSVWHESAGIAGALKYYNTFTGIKNTDPGPDGAAAYSAAFVAASALERADSLQTGDLKEALASTEMTTVFGPVEFGPYDGKLNQDTGGAYAGQWVEGSFSLVWPAEVAGSDPVLPEKPISRSR